MRAIGRDGALNHKAIDPRTLSAMLSERGAERLDLAA